MVRVDEDDRPRASRSRPTATAATPSSTRTPGAQLALAEAYRNVAATGAAPLAVTDCLNFGSPEDPDVMWQFAEAVRGLADGCLRARASRSPAATSASTTRPATTPILPDAGGRRARRDRRRRPAHPGRASAATATLIYLLGDTARRARRLGVGARRARPPRRPAAGGRPRARARAGRLLIDASRDGLDRRRARPVRRRPGAGPGRVVPARRRRRPGRCVPRRRSTRSSRCSPSRPGGRSSPCRAREEVRFTDMCAARGLPAHPHRRHRRALRRARGAGPVQRAAARPRCRLAYGSARTVRVRFRRSGSFVIGS